MRVNNDKNVKNVNFKKCKVCIRNNKNRCNHCCQCVSDNHSGRYCHRYQCKFTGQALIETGATGQPLAK